MKCIDSAYCNNCGKQPLVITKLVFKNKIPITYCSNEEICKKHAEKHAGLVQNF